MPHKNSYVHTDVGPWCGNPASSRHTQIVDDEMKAIIAGTLRDLEQTSPNGGWDAVMSVIMQNNQLEPIQNSAVHRVATFTSPKLFTFGIIGTQDEDLIQELCSFFNKQIDDLDVALCTNISLANLSHAIVPFSRPQVDIGILRYASSDKPVFKVYRIKVSGQASQGSEFKGLMISDMSESRVTVEYNAHSFQLRKDVIERLFDMSSNVLFG